MSQGIAAIYNPLVEPINFFSGISILASKLPAEHLCSEMRDGKPGPATSVGLFKGYTPNVQMEPSSIQLTEVTHR